MLVRCVSQRTAWGDRISRRVHRCEPTDLRGLGGFTPKSYLHLQSYSTAFTQASNSIETFVLQTVFCVSKMGNVRFPMLQKLQPFRDYKGT